MMLCNFSCWSPSDGPSDWRFGLCHAWGHVFRFDSHFIPFSSANKFHQKKRSLERAVWKIYSGQDKMCHSVTWKGGQRKKSDPSEQGCLSFRILKFKLNPDWSIILNRFSCPEKRLDYSLSLNSIKQNVCRKMMRREGGEWQHQHLLGFWFKTLSPRTNRSIRLPFFQRIKSWREYLKLKYTQELCWLFYFLLLQKSNNDDYWWWSSWWWCLLEFSKSLNFSVPRSISDNHWAHRIVFQSDELLAGKIRKPSSDDWVTLALLFPLLQWLRERNHHPKNFFTPKKYRTPVNRFPETPTWQIVENCTEWYIPLLWMKLYSLLFSHRT